MNIHPLTMAAQSLDDAIFATIDPSHRGELAVCLHKIDIVLRGHGVFMGFHTEPITMQQQACSLRRDEVSLRARKENTFPHRSPVKVDSARYHGYGVVALSDGTPADFLAVRLENGNTWWYPVEDCTPVKWSVVDKATRRAYLQSRGYLKGGVL